jgi:PAS domain S-box-containing protein
MTHYLEHELYQLIQTDSQIFEFIETHILDGLWYWDLEHSENEWKHPQYWRTLGYDPDEMPHRSSSWQQLIHPEDLKLSNLNLQKHLADPSYPYDQIVRYRHKDGKTVWMRCRGIAIRDEAGKPKRMLGVHIDITAAKHAEQQALQNAAFYKTILDNQSTYIIKLDRHGNYTYVNDIYQRDFGSPTEPLVGRFSLSSVLTEDQATCVDITQYCFTHPGEHVQAPLHKYFRDGTIHANNWEFVGLLEAGQVQEMLCIGIDVSAQRAAENALAASQHRFAHIAQHLAEGIMVIEGSAITYLSPSYRRFWGKRDYPQQFSQLYASVHPDDRRWVRQQLKHALGKQQREVTYEYRATNHEGKRPVYQWREAHATLFYRTDGDFKQAFEQAIVIVRDISAQKQSEAALRESQELLEYTEQVANIGGWILDVKSQQVVWSKQVYRLFDIPLEQPLSLELAMAFCVEPHKLEEVVSEAIEHAKAYDLELEVLTLDQRQRWLRVVGTPIVRDGEVVTLRGSLQDITDRKQAELALRESQQKFEATLHSIDDLVFALDKDGFYREYYQPSNNPMLYVTPDVFLHQHYRQIMPPHVCTLIDRLYARLQQGESGYAFDYDLDIGGELRWFSAKVSRRNDAVGNFAGVTIVSRDITERKQTEANLADTLHEKTVLLQEIHHRVKNNLQVVASLLALQAHSLTDEVAKNALTESRSRVLAMATVHKALYESDSLSRVDFAAYLRQLVPSMLKSSSATYIAINYDLEPVELSIEDAIPCGLIINELLSNTLKHAFVGVERVPLVKIQLKQQDQTVHVGVIDNGCGLPEHINNDTLTSLDSLGMSIIAALAGQVAGTLQLERLEPGSAITLQFSVQQPTSQPLAQHL